MKTRRPKSRTTSTAIIFATASLLPSIALAQVKITEVMYDAPGSDSGREWVEVANISSQNLDIGKYKFAESGTNHGLKVVQGSSVLPPNGVAIIAADAQKFLADYPAYTGALFDSAFSLSNTGETLAIKNASSTALDTVSYAAAAQANGTGGSLNRQGESFVVAMASPGVNPSPMTPVPQAPAKEKASSTKKIPSKTTATSPSKNFAKQGSATSPLASNSPQTSAASLLALPNLSEPVLIGLGLLSVVLLGVAGVFFIRLKGQETSLSAEEFTIE